MCLAENTIVACLISDSIVFMFLINLCVFKHNCLIYGVCAFWRSGRRFSVCQGCVCQGRICGGVRRRGEKDDAAGSSEQGSQYRDGGKRFFVGENPFDSAFDVVFAKGNGRGKIPFLTPVFGGRQCQQGLAVVRFFVLAETCKHPFIARLFQFSLKYFVHKP